MNLSDARQLARQLMNEHGAKDVPLVISNGKRQLGVCSWKTSNADYNDFTAQIFGLQKSRRSNRRFEGATCKCIKLSRHLVTLNDESEIRSTMLHEIAHYLAGPMHGHDAIWRRKAIEIGCNGKRLNSTAKMPEGRYKAECRCGKVFYKHRKGKHVLTGVYTCRTCGGKIRFVDTLAIA